MKLHKSQNGHLHIGLVLIAIVALVVMVGLGVRSRQSLDLSRATASLTTPPQTCEDLDLLTDEEYNSLSQEFIDSLCGYPEADPSNDPTLVDDPCAAIYSQYTDDQLNNMTDEEFAALCDESPATQIPTADETTDGGQAPAPAVDIPVQAGTSSAVVVKKIDLANKQACLNSASQIPLAQGKAFGIARIKSRVKDVQTASKNVDKNYAGSDIAKNLKARQKAAQKLVKRTAKRVHKSASSAGNIKLPKITNHKKQLKNRLSAYNKLLSSANSKLKASKSSQSAAEATCSAIFDSQIYSGIVPWVRLQQTVDNLSAQNAAYEISYQTAAVMGKLRGKSVQLTNPSVIKAGINGLQTSLDNAGPSFNAQDLKPGIRKVKAGLKHASQQSNASIRTLH